MAEPSKLIIRRGCFGEAGALAASLLKPGLAAILSDERVMALYGAQLKLSLEQAGFRVVSHAVPPGEQSKSLERYGELLAFLAGEGLTRQDAVFALGGGVVGDLAGFAAATYLRGIPLVQIPTSLLACVDSSVGGKTAIDLPQGKNLVGAFHPARLVLIDPDLLRSLPEAVYRDGLAEVVKTAAIADQALFHDIPYDVDEEEGVIRRCIAIKAGIVQEDPRDEGRRQLLNFGHSFGHAIETLSGFQLSHGQAVSIGMAIIARASQRAGLCGREASGRLQSLLRLLGLPTLCDLPEEDIYRVLLSDKKRRQDRVTLVMLHEIGDCRLHEYGLDEARGILRMGLKA